MALQFTPFLIPLLLAVLFLCGMAVYLWRRRLARGAVPFLITVAALVLWVISYMLELSGVNLTTKILGFKLSFIGIVTVPTAWFVFTLLYTGRGHWIRWPRWLGFIVVPVITLVLIWTWDSHHLFWTDISMQENYSQLVGNYSTLHPVNGVLYFLHAIYSYGLLLAGTVVILQAHLGLPRPFWGQKITLLFSTLFPWMANAIYILGLSPVPGLDLTPFAITISAMGIAVSLFGFRLFDLVPVAHETIFRNMDDGFLLLDIRYRIQDLNPAAAKILKVSQLKLIGKNAGEVLQRLPGLEDLALNDSLQRREFTLQDDAGQHDYDMHVTALSSLAGDATGWLLTLRDITFQKLTEEYLHRRTAFLEVFNNIIAAAATADDLQSMMSTALEQTLQVLKLPSGSMWIKEHAIQQNLTLEAAGLLVSLCDMKRLLNQQEVQSGLLVVEDWAVPPIPAPDTEGEEWADLPGKFIQAGILASISVDVRSHLACIGHISVVSPTGRRWEKEEVALLDAVGRQVGAVAERLMALQQTQERNLLMARLIEQSTALNRNFHVNEVLPAISRGVTELLNPDKVDIFLSEPAPPVQVEEAATQGTTSPDPRPVLIPDVERVKNSTAEDSQSVDYRAMGTWPLLYGERTLAVVSIYYNQPHNWSDAEQEVMVTFTRQAAIALENARLFDAEREHFILAEALRELATVVNSTLDFNEVLEKILSNLSWALPHDRADIMLIEDGQARVVHSQGYEKVGLLDWVRSLRLPVEQVPLLQQVVQSGEVVMLPETSQSDLWAEFQPGSLCRAYLGAPIIRKGTVVGLINVYSEKAGVYHTQHEETLRAFTDQAAIALENASLYSAMHEQAAESASLYRAVTRLFTLGGDLSALAEEIASAVTSEFNQAHCSVLFYDEVNSELVIKAQSGYAQSNPKRLQVDGSGLTVTAFRTGEVVYAPDVNLDPRYVSGTPMTRSELVFPLRAHGQVFGVLNLESPQAESFDEKDQRVLAAFADRAALAIENARLFELTDFQLRQINLLNSITRASLEAFDFHIMLAVMVDRLRDLFGADGCYVALWDEEQQTVMPGAGSHIMDETHLHLAPATGEPSLVEVVINASGQLAIENLNTSRLVSPRLANSLGIQALLGLPLVATQQKLGAVLVMYDRPRRFSSHEVRLAEQAAGQVALAIGRARSLEASQRRAQEADNLRQATAALTAALDLRQVLDNILDHLEQVLPYDRASVYLLEEQTLHAVAASGFLAEQQVLGYNFPASNAIAQQIISVGTPIILEDAAQEPRFTGWIETGFVRGWMGVPLVIHGSLIGILTIGRQLVGAFGREQAKLAQAFASQAAAAIANARLFSEVQRLAITDPLTGLYNRRGFSEIGHREIERTRRYKRPLSAVMIDIDHFKRINDTYKHAIGDQVLRTLAERCRKRTRELDILGRYGGEEIVILLPETDRAGALGAAEHLRRDVADEPFDTDVGPLWVTISLGVADSIDGNLELDSLVDRADAAMYAAKQSGRNRVMSY